MAVTIRIAVEDVAERISDGYGRIELESASAVAGSYSSVDNEALVAGTFYYEIEDSSGDLNTWYRYRFAAAGGGSPESAYTNPFQPEGATRKKVRQLYLERFDAGMVLASDSGGSSTAIITADYRVKSTVYPDGRGKGTWIRPTTGSRAGETRQITTSDVSAGSFTVGPAMSGALSSGDEFEWHWLADPDVADRALNRAMLRQWFLERVPIEGVADQYEYPLLDYAPWLEQKERVHGVWHYPGATSTTPAGVDEPWAGTGYWWQVREDNGLYTLQIKPAFSSKLIYLECSRRMPQLYTDASVAPSAMDIDLAAALTYDEVLAELSRVENGSDADRERFKKQRVELASETLAPLWAKNRVRPRPVPPNTPIPNVAPVIWKAR